MVVVVFALGRAEYCGVPGQGLACTPPQVCSHCGVKDSTYLCSRVSTTPTVGNLCCPLGANNDICSGNGNCTGIGFFYGACNCYFGWSGATCETQTSKYAFQLYSIDGSHCQALWVLDNTTSCFDAYWSAHGYQFSTFLPGNCPIPFTHIDNYNSICPDLQSGLNGNVVALMYGIPQPPQSKATSSAHAPTLTHGYQWNSCGTATDRLVTKNLNVQGHISAMQNITVVATGGTNLHQPLISGSWQVWIYELGLPHSVATDFGDLVSAVVFDNPDAPTSFTLTVRIQVPQKEATGQFTANLVGVDQAKAEYFCLDLAYQI